MGVSNKICFLQLAHPHDDDRVWYHQAKSLKDNGFNVSIISTQTPCSDLENVFYIDSFGIKKSDVCKKISLKLNDIEPDVIICDNPLAVFYASRFKKKYRKKCKIIMDVTEWYPSKKNLVNLNGIQRFIKKTILQCLNFYSGFLADAFIFGEYHKAKFFKNNFKRKNAIDLPYYPDLKYIKVGKTKQDFSTWNLMYSGLLTKEKGFYNVLNATKVTAKNNPNCTFFLTIISKENINEVIVSRILEMPENVEIIFNDYLPFEEFCQKISDYDLFFDLRGKDKENDKCLPIKLFYYMACGRPSIFSDLEAIKIQVPEINEFACITNPNDDQNISHFITEYIYNPNKYHQHCAAALEYANQKYNWGTLSANFLKFISNFCD